MLRFKPCPLFVFLSPEKLRFCLSCNFVAKVRIISETTKLFSNFFAIFCKNLLLASAEANFSLFTLHFSLFLSCHFSVSEIPPRHAPAVISTRETCHLSPWYLVAVLFSNQCTYPLTQLPTYDRSIPGLFPEKVDYKALLLIYIIIYIIIKLFSL